jgi:hypothetical protein
MNKLYTVQIISLYFMSVDDRVIVHAVLFIIRLFCSIHDPTYCIFPSLPFFSSLLLFPSPPPPTLIPTYGSPLPSSPKGSRSLFKASPPYLKPLVVQSCQSYGRGLGGRVQGRPIASLFDLNRSELFIEANRFLKGVSSTHVYFTARTVHYLQECILSNFRKYPPPHKII